MEIAVIGARGSVGRVCMEEIRTQGHNSIGLTRNEDVPANIDGVIVASPIESRDFNIPLVDCSGELSNTQLVLPNILDSNARRRRIPNCMASLISQALAPLHKKCTIKSIIATCLQSVSGAGWRGVQALEQKQTEELFSGQLVNNILPHENAAHEEQEIRNDIKEIFGCDITATSFRVPVVLGHLASLRVETKNPIDECLLPCSDNFDPCTMVNKREVAIGRVRVQKNTADLVVCGDQLLCGTAIPAVSSILCA
jgi:aspartate-semialdehyde dehydrogenase